MASTPRNIAIRYGLIGLGTLCGLAATIVGFENWRGLRAWRNTEADLTTRGIRFKLDQFDQPPIPSDQNLFEAPILVALVGSGHKDSDEAQLWQAARINQIPPTSTTKERVNVLGQIRDHLHEFGLLPGLPTADPADDMRAALQPVTLLLDEVRNATRQRPDVWLPRLSYREESPLDWETLFRLCNALHVRALVQIAAAQPGEAYADLIASLQLADAMSRSPSPWIAVLVAQSLRMGATRALEEGLRQRAWSGPQLEEIQRLLEGFRGIGRLRDAWEIELAVFVDAIDSAGTVAGPESPWWMLPGWLAQEKVLSTRFIAEKMFPIFDTLNDQLSPPDFAELEAVEKIPPSSFLPYGRLGYVSRPGISSVASDFARSNNVIVLATAAIALERYRLDRGSYPATLEVLVPAFLSAVPHDTRAALPITYTPTPEGGFLLRAIAPGGSGPPEEWRQNP